jgi:hypothetical protein
MRRGRSEFVISAAALIFCACGSASAPGRSAEDGRVSVEALALEGAATATLLVAGSGKSLQVEAAQGSLLATGDAFECEETAGGARLSCRRGEDTLDVLHRQDARVAAVFRKGGYASDVRAFFNCDHASHGHGERRLACSAFTPQDHVAGNFVSPFASDVPGIDIRNVHVVAQTDTGVRVLRGMAPHTPAEYAELTSAGVGRVLLFKDPEPNTPPDRTDIVLEEKTLAPLGIEAVNVPFKWRDFTDFETPCTQTIDALRALKASIDESKSAYFHCTVGEDRTGYLAGLFRMLREGRSHEDVFVHEMCEHGYSAGDPQKPFAHVVERIDADLTPVFTKMAFKIARGEIAWDHLDAGTCRNDPGSDPEYAADPAFQPERFRCMASTNYGRP